MKAPPPSSSPIPLFLGSLRPLVRLDPSSYLLCPPSSLSPSLPPSASIRFPFLPPPPSCPPAPSAPSSPCVPSPLSLCSSPSPSLSSPRPRLVRSAGATKKNICGVLNTFTTQIKMFRASCLPALAADVRCLRRRVAPGGGEGAAGAPRPPLPGRVVGQVGRESVAGIASDRNRTVKIQMIVWAELFAGNEGAGLWSIITGVGRAQCDPTGLFTVGFCLRQRCILTLNCDGSRVHWRARPEIMAQHSMVFIKQELTSLILRL